MSVEEYFQLEANDPETGYEYIDGYVYAMAGGTANHDTIKSNIQHRFIGSAERVLPLNATLPDATSGGAEQ